MNAWPQTQLEPSIPIRRSFMLEVRFFIYYVLCILLEVRGIT